MRTRGWLRYAAGAALTAALLAQSLAASAMTVTSTRLPDGVAGKGYSTRLAATGGKAPERWSLVSGALPPALKLSMAGVISGTPSRAGSYAFRVKVTDSASPRQAVGAIAWYNHDHVAYVERVNSPTSIVISEMNYDFGNGFWVHTVTAGQSGWPTDFIHIADR